MFTDDFVVFYGTLALGVVHALGCVVLAIAIARARTPWTRGARIAAAAGSALLALAPLAAAIYGAWQRDPSSQVVAAVEVGALALVFHVTRRGAPSPRA